MTSFTIKERATIAPLVRAFIVDADHTAALAAAKNILMYKHGSTEARAAIEAFEYILNDRLGFKGRIDRVEVMDLSTRIRWALREVGVEFDRDELIALDNRCFWLNAPVTSLRSAQHLIEYLVEEGHLPALGSADLLFDKKLCDRFPPPLGEALKKRIVEIAALFNDMVEQNEFCETVIAEANERRLEKFRQIMTAAFGPGDQS